MRKKIIPGLDLSGWTILNEEVDTEYLKWNKINAIYNLNLTAEPWLIPYQQDFVSGCLTRLRFPDFSNVRKSDMINNRLRLKQQKSDSWVIVPLRDTTIKILQNKFKNRPFYHTNPEFNRHIKTLAKMAGIDEMIKHSYKKGNRKIVETKPK